MGILHAHCRDHEPPVAVLCKTATASGDQVCSGSPTSCCVTAHAGGRRPAYASYTTPIIDRSVADGSRQVKRELARPALPELCNALALRLQQQPRPRSANKHTANGASGGRIELVV